MPMEMKNRLVKIILNGRTPSTTLRLYSDSASSSPAMNAPSERESPSQAVPTAMARHRPSVPISSSSRLRERTIMSMSLGSTCLARIQPPPSIATVRAPESSSSAAPAFCCPESSGTSSIMGTMARS